MPEEKSVYADGGRGVTMYERLNAGQMFAALREEVKKNAAILLGAIVLLVVSQLLVDSYVKSASLAVSGMINLLIQFAVTRSALDRSGMLPQDAGKKFFSFWGMNILSNIAILVGCMLLILPGLYLAARWLIAGPALIVEDRSAGEGLRESWERTRSSVWSAMGALLLLYGCGFFLALLPFLFFPAMSETLPLQALSGFFSSTTIALGWLMGVGTYKLISRPQQALEEVFA
jgi:hypothetical protein